MTMTIRNAAVWLALAVLLGVPSALQAQTQIDHTTFSPAVAVGDTSVTLAAAAGSSVGDYLYVEGEMLQLLSAVNDSTTNWNVRRGEAGGLTPARAHPTTAIVWVLDSQEGDSFDVSGTCTATSERFLPHINTRLNHIFDCTGGYWVMRDADRVNVAYANTFGAGKLRVREEFNGGHHIMQDDGTAKSVTDAEVNYVAGSALGPITYREELGKTTSSWIAINGRLDISADDTIDEEGVEILFGVNGSTAEDQLFEAGTHGMCITAMITITDISGTDQVQLGFRQNEAFQDVNAYAGYTVWNTVGVNNVDGSIVSSQEVSEATDTDDSGVNWADGERRALRVCVSSGGVPTAFYSNASPDNEEPLMNAITMTETGATLTAGTGMVPYFSYLAESTDGADVFIEWVELSYAP